MPKLSAEISFGSILQILALVATVAVGYGAFRSEFSELRAANEQLTLKVEALTARVAVLNLDVVKLQTQMDMQRVQR